MIRDAERLMRELQKLQASLDREIDYTRKVNDKNALLTDQIKDLKKQLENAIPKAEHERILAALHSEYKHKLSEIKIRQSKPRNERGAGRKRVASKAIAARVIELHTDGLSQAKIAAALADEFGIKIGRTVVGEIIRGEYEPSDLE